MNKLNKLCAILFAVLGVTTLKAQTDVTSTYLTNADFEGNYTSVYEIKSDGRHIYQPEGWAVDYKTSSQWNMTVVGSTDAMASNFTGTYAVSAENNRYMVRFRDNNPSEYVDLSQTITIKETGTYTFSADLIREDGSKVNVQLYAGGTNVTNSAAGTWENRSFSIVLSEGDEIKVGLRFINVGAGGNKIGADNVKITYEPLGSVEQNWTAPVIGIDLATATGSEELYMYNVEADAFASAGMAWSTHAIVKELQNGDKKLSAGVHNCTINKPADGQVKIKLNGREWLGASDISQVNDVWVDNGSDNTVYNYTEVSENVYTLQLTTDATKYLDCSWAYGGHITFNSGYGNDTWAFVLRTDITNGKYLLYKAKKEMYDIYNAVVEAGHEDAYEEALSIANISYTDANATAESVNAATKSLLKTVAPALTSGYFAANSLFTNPDMRGYGDDTDWGNGLNAFADGIFESWHSSETVTQKQVNLPNGFYTVEFIGIYRQDGGDAAPTLTLTSGSNSAKVNLRALTEIDFGNCRGGNKWTDANKPDDKYSGGEALAHTDANAKVENFFVENGELTVTVAMPSGSQWLLCQGFRISFKAESLEQYANLFKEAKAAAEAIDQDALNTYAKNELAAALSNAAEEQINKEWYQARTAELNNAVALANSVIAPYESVKSLLTTCESIITNSVEFEDGAKETFQTIINTAKTDVESAETADAINAIYNTLETARQTYVQQADPTNDTYFDYTFKLTNSAFDNGTTGWTCTSGAQNKGIASNKTNGIITGAFYENWNPSNFTGEIYQTVSNLPSGVYKLTVAAFGAGTNVYANDKQIAVTTGDGAWYEVDQVTVGDGTLKFGIKNENATTWMGIDNASLEYYGFDVATAQSAIRSMVTEAEGLVGKPMNADVASALQAAIDGTDATKTTRNELSPMIEALNKAIANAKASVADYSRLAKYIEMTKVFTDVNAYETNYNEGEYTADDVETVRQELNVLRFNAASEIFPNKIEVTGWEGSMGGKNTSGQHWDGTDTKYYDNNSWNGNAHSTMTSIELPKGTYVLKAALRSSANTTLTLTVLDQIVNVEGKGDTGYGVDTKGDANFSSDGSYANNNAGRGWEWEFVKFELEETTTVTLKVECNYNGVYGWASFSDITLWMDDETYMTVNGHAINEPLADAKSLVDTKPMGAAENDALKAAIALGENVSTAQELTKAIEDLNTAVANANAWVVAYNEAKAPLVAALERFESDYNNAENGALKHMNKDCWTNVLNMAQAAAVAKDVTDSYAGFATATENLVVALDAATTSINDYAALDEAIKNAESISGANVGDKAFQRPQSAADKMGIANAQDVYKNATADGEGVTSVTTSLNEAVTTFKAVPLNAPADGQRFNIVMDYEGWEHHGKAATYLANNRTDAGNYNIKYYTAPNVNYAQAFTFTAVEGKTDCYTLSMTDVDNNERYVCTGTVYGGNASQIRTTTDASKALAVKVIATATDSVHQLWNTEANNYLGGQDAGFFTVNSHTTFRLQEAQKAEVTLNITDAGWATLILPFNAEIPEGVKAYTSVALDGESVELVQVSEGGIKANTPYLIKGTTGEYTFSGYGLADKESYADEKGLFVGTYVAYTTTGGEYVLQKHDDKVGFYVVGKSAESAKPKVNAYRCYLTAPASEIKAFFFFDDDDVTGINGVDAADIEIEAIYTINGAKVNSLQKGLNIVKMSNGKVKKVFVK